MTYFVYYLIRSPTGDTILPPEFIYPLSEFIIHTLHCFSEKYISIITSQRSQVYVKEGKRELGLTSCEQYFQSELSSLPCMELASI